MYISFSYSILISLYKFGYLSYWLNILCIVAGNCSIAIFFLHTHTISFWFFIIHQLVQRVLPTWLLRYTIQMFIKIQLKDIKITWLLPSELHFIKVFLTKRGGKSTKGKVHSPLPAGLLAMQALSFVGYCGRQPENKPGLIPGAICRWA